MRALSLVFVGLFVLSVLIQLGTWRRQRRVRPVLIAVSQLAALAACIVFSAVTRHPPGPGWWMVLLGGGIAFGVVYGGFVRVDRTERGVVMGYTIPWIVTWSTLMVITQLTAIFGQTVPAVIYSLAIANLGINLGMNGRVLSGYGTLRGAPAVGVLLVFGLAVALALPATAQTEGGDPVSYVGVYEGRVSPGTADEMNSDTWVHWCGVPDFHMRESPNGPGARIEFAVSDGGIVTGVIDHRYQSDLRGDFFFEWECRGVAEGPIVECEGPAYTGKGTTFNLDYPSVTLSATIGGDGAFVGTLENEYVAVDIVRETINVSGAAVSGGPAEPSGVPPATALGETDVSAPVTDETLVTVPATEGSDVEVGAVPVVLPDEPLSDEEVARAVALANLVLAGGSLAQLLPLLQSGMSLAEALRISQGSAVFPESDAALVPMDPDDVAYVREMESQGYRWSDRYGWSTTEQDAMRAGWEARNRAAMAREREEFLAGREQERAEWQRRQDALDYLHRATESAIERTGTERYDQLVSQISEQAYNADGSVNVEYVGRLREGMGRMLRRDMQIPDESLQDNWVADFVQGTWEEARHSALIRLGAGVVTGAQSEWYYQSQAVYDAMAQASMEGDLSYIDGLRIAYTAVADENLPVTTIRKLASGEEVSVLDVVGDVMKGVNVRNQTKATMGEHLPDGNGLVGWQRRAIQAEANRSGVNMLFRKVNVDASKVRGMPGKLPWMKQKSINPKDVEYLGYSRSQLGQVPAGPPRPPSRAAFSSTDEYAEAMAYYQKRVAKWDEVGAATTESLAVGEVVEVDGVLYTVDASGNPGQPYISDLDPAHMTDSLGRPLTDHEAKVIMDRLEQRGLASGGHGSPYTWNAVTDKEKAFKAALIEAIERGDDAGEMFLTGGTAGTPPRWTFEIHGDQVHITPGVAGASIHDLQEHGL